MNSHADPEQNGSGTPSGHHHADVDPEVLLAKVEELEKRLVTVQQRIVYGVKLVLPVALFFLMLAVVYLFFPALFGETVTRVSSTLIAGKFSAAGGQHDFWFWLVVLGSIDVLVGLWLLWNFDLLFKLPVLGPRFQRAEALGRSFLGHHQWVRRTAFLGIVIIVIVPFQGTGAVMASLVGRMIGMGPLRAFLAIMIGSYAGYALILGGSAALVEAFETGLAFGLVLAVGVLLALVAVWWRWFRFKRTHPTERPRAGE